MTPFSIGTRASLDWWDPPGSLVKVQHGLRDELEANLAARRPLLVLNIGQHNTSGSVIEFRGDQWATTRAIVLPLTRGQADDKQALETAGQTLSQVLRVSRTNPFPGMVLIVGAARHSSTSPELWSAILGAPVRMIDPALIPTLAAPVSALLGPFATKAAVAESVKAGSLSGEPTGAVLGSGVVEPTSTLTRQVLVGMGVTTAVVAIAASVISTALPPFGGGPGAPGGEQYASDVDPSALEIKPDSYGLASPAVPGLPADPVPERFRLPFGDPAYGEPIANRPPTVTGVLPLPGAESQSRGSWQQPLPSAQPRSEHVPPGDGPELPLSPAPQVSQPGPSAPAAPSEPGGGQAPVVDFAPSPSPSPVASFSPSAAAAQPSSPSPSPSASPSTPSPGSGGAVDPSDDSGGGTSNPSASGATGGTGSSDSPTTGGSTDSSGSGGSSGTSGTSHVPTDSGGSAVSGGEVTTPSNPSPSPSPSSGSGAASGTSGSSTSSPSAVPPASPSDPAPSAPAAPSDQAEPPAPSTPDPAPAPSDPPVTQTPEPGPAPQPAPLPDPLPVPEPAPVLPELPGVEIPEVPIEPDVPYDLIPVPAPIPDLDQDPEPEPLPHFPDTAGAGNSGNTDNQGNPGNSGQGNTNPGTPQGPGSSSQVLGSSDIFGI